MATSNPFGFLGTILTAPQTVAVQPQLAGQNDWILQQIQRRKELMDVMQVDPNDWFGKAMAEQAINQALQSDPATEERKLRMYEGTMNRLADAANERAMKGHIFAGLINLPWEKARSEKYRFVKPNLEFTARGIQPGSPFVTRQYVTI